ncbi:MAG TPA: YbaK/EbsC family protein, partial [Candidatus Polarisedimenticolaceae bacterium]|nr:YbaK/EbsC family protein [Candidatus Polarisedimenticolaceae bacterium]
RVQSARRTQHEQPEVGVDFGHDRFRADLERLAAGVGCLAGGSRGSVPPFGPPITGLELYVDESILRNDRVAFNAGSLTDSILMERSTYVEIAKPVEIFSFSRP